VEERGYILLMLNWSSLLHDIESMETKIDRLRSIPHRDNERIRRKILGWKGKWQDHWPWNQ